MCLQFANLQFSWWSRDHFSAPFRGLYLPNAWSQTLLTSKRHTFKVSAFHRYHWFGAKTVFCTLCAGWSKGTLKTRKMLFLSGGKPTLQNSGIFHEHKHPSIFPLWRFAAEIAAIRRLYIGLMVRYKYYRKEHSRSGLAWSRPRADHGLSRPTSVFRTKIGVYKSLSRSVEIWQYEGQKPILE